MLTSRSTADVWNASLLLAEFIDVPSVGTDMKHSSIAVKGERVLEVGAGQ